MDQCLKSGRKSKKKQIHLNVGGKEKENQAKNSNGDPKWGSSRFVEGGDIRERLGFGVDSPGGPEKKAEWIKTALTDRRRINFTTTITRGLGDGARLFLGKGV